MVWQNFVGHVIGIILYSVSAAAGLGTNTHNSFSFTWASGKVFDYICKPGSLAVRFNIFANPQ